MRPKKFAVNWFLGRENKLIPLGLFCHCPNIVRFKHLRNFSPPAAMTTVTEGTEKYNTNIKTNPIPNFRMMAVVLHGDHHIAFQHISSRHAFGTIF
ncbi:MAG TPA: hypothetical protein VF472_02440 [Burkholderiaceae bacterium]